jgi:deazaflavin-dependent oxidoreductase (nitroreductase family)
MLTRPLGRGVVGGCRGERGVTWEEKFGKPFAELSRAERNQLMIDDIRASGGTGKVGGVPTLILHTTGAKSGAKRENPVAFLDFDGRRFVFATKGGADTHPDWYHNVVAYPDVVVEDGTETYAARAHSLTGSDRDRIWGEQASRVANFAEYQKNTTRVIPVVELVRSDASY